MEKLLELWHTTLGKVIACLLAIALAFMGWNIAMIMGAFGSDDNQTAATEDVATEGDESSTPESADESADSGEKGDAANNASAPVPAEKDSSSAKETSSASAAVSADKEAALKIPANIDAYDKDGNKLEGTVKVDPGEKQTIYVAASKDGEQIGAVTVSGTKKDLVDDNAEVPAAAADAAGSDVALVPVEIPAADLESGETTKIDATTEETPADDNAEADGDKAQGAEADKDSAAVDGDESKDAAKDGNETAGASKDSEKVEVKDEKKAEQPKIDNEGVIAKGVEAPAFEGYAYVTKGAVFGIFGGTQVTVKVSAGEGVVPQGTTVEATLIDPSEYAELLEGAGLESATATLVDINLVYEGNYIQPNGAVNVSIFDPDVALPAEGGELQVVHIADTSADHGAVSASEIINPAGSSSDDGAATDEGPASDEGTAVDDPAASEPEATIVETRQADDTCVSFDTEHFSIYAIAGSTMLKAGTVACITESGATIGSADLYVGNSSDASYTVKNLANGYEPSGLQVKSGGSWVAVDNIWNDGGNVVYAGGSIDSTSDVRIVAKKVKYITFNVDVQNADLQLVPVHVGPKPSAGKASVASGNWGDRVNASGSKTFTIEDGTVFLFFVKGTDTHLVTGVNPQGNGTESRIFDIDQAKDWDGTDAIRAAAKADGYVAYFGYTRYLTDNTGTNQTISVTVKGTAPSLDMTAKVVSDKDQLAPGDKIDIELEVKPQLSVNGYTFTIDDPVINELTIGSKKFDLSKVSLAKKSDGAYVATVKDYAVTSEDCIGSSNIAIKASASTIYHYSFVAGTGSQTAQVSSAVSIEGSAQTSVKIQPAAGVYYDYAFDYDQYPSSDAAIPAKPANPGITYGFVDVVNTPEIGERVHDDGLHGTWKFEGWKKDDALVGGTTLPIADDSTVYIIGHWSFIPDYVVTWVSESATVATGYYWNEAGHDSLAVPADPSKGADAANTYVFAGWMDDSGNAAPAAGSVVIANATYYAQFTANPKPKYAVVYHNNYAGAADDVWRTDGDVIEGSDRAIVADAPIRDGYVFLGWKSVADGVDASGAQYYRSTPDEAKGISDVVKNVTGIVDLYACWQKVVDDEFAIGIKESKVYNPQVWDNYNGLFADLSYYKWSGLDQDAHASYRLYNGKDKDKATAGDQVKITGKAAGEDMLVLAVDNPTVGASVFGPDVVVKLKVSVFDKTAVYLYLKVYDSSKGESATSAISDETKAKALEKYGLSYNNTGWFTYGTVSDVDMNLLPVKNGQHHFVTSDETSAFVDAVKGGGASGLVVNPYNSNTLAFGDADWSSDGVDFGLAECVQGALPYVSDGDTWHLNGRLDIADPSVPGGDTPGTSDPAAKHSLTINYVDEAGNPMPGISAYVEEIAEGIDYSVASPFVAGYDPDQPVVAGTMNGSDITVTVVYKAKASVVTQHSLTVHYVYADGSEAYATHRSLVDKGAQFSVASPVLVGFTASVATIAGTMGDENLEFTVVYTAVSPSPSPNPGGGTTDPGTNPGGTTDPGTTPGGNTDNPGTTDPGTDNPGVTPGGDNPGTTDPGTDGPGGNTDNPGTADPGTDNPGSNPGGADDPGSNPGGDADNPSSSDNNGGAGDNNGGDSSDNSTPSRPGTTAIVIPGGTSNPVYPIIQTLGTPVAVDDNPNPLAGAAANDEDNVTLIDEDGNALMTVDSCWVHFYMIIGLIITALYGLGVIGRRRAYAGSINKLVDSVVSKKNEQ